MLKRRQTKKSDRKYWIDQLDKVFSLYIRMRDSRESHYKSFRCISCGDVKPFEQMDCGHFVSRNAMALRWNEQNCNGECSSCLTPDALILMEDLTWKSLGELQVMDKVVSFEEEKTDGYFRRYKVATVTHIHREIQDVYEVCLANGDKIKTTAEHKWLARGRGKYSFGYRWIETKNLWFDGHNIEGIKKTGPKGGNSNSMVCKPINVIFQEKSYEAGWIAGMIDADGHITQQNIHDPDGSIRYGFRIGIAQCEKYMDICHNIVKWLEYFTGNHKTCRQYIGSSGRIGSDHRGIRNTYQTWQFLITGTNIEKLQFLMRTRPNKIKKVNIEKLGKMKSQYDTEVKSIKYVGKEEIVVMETDTHTFIANGYAMHNCNRFHSDHILGYRKNLIIKLGTDAISGSAIAQALEPKKRLALIQKIGEQKVQALEAQKYTTKKWSVEEMQQMYAYYAALVLKMKDEM